MPERGDISEAQYLLHKYKLLTLDMVSNWIRWRGEIAVANVHELYSVSTLNLAIHVKLRWVANNNICRVLLSARQRR